MLMGNKEWKELSEIRLTKICKMNWSSIKIIKMILNRRNHLIRMIKELCLLNKIILMMLYQKNKRFNFAKKNYFNNIVRNKILSKIFLCLISKVKIISMINLIKRIALRKMVTLKLKNNLFLNQIKWDRLIWFKMQMMIGLTLFYLISQKGVPKFFFKLNLLAGCRLLL